MEKDEETLWAFLQRYIYGVSDFAEYIELRGGAARMAELRTEELLTGEKQ